SASSFVSARVALSGHSLFPLLRHLPELRDSRPPSVASRCRHLFRGHLPPPKSKQLLALLTLNTLILELKSDGPSQCTTGPPACPCGNTQMRKRLVTMPITESESISELAHRRLGAFRLISTMTTCHQFVARETRLTGSSATESIINAS